MTSSSRRDICVVLLVVLVAAGTGQPPNQPSVYAAQDQPARPIFRTDINAVVVDVRVVDSEGNFVRDLTRDDFTIFEDGRAQAITAFDLVDIPVDPSALAAAGSRVEPDVASNSIGSEGRLYAIVLDDAMGRRELSPTVRAIAREFIEHHLTDADRAIVLPTSGRRDMTQEFTANRQQLIAAVNKYEGDYGDPTRANGRTMAMVSVESLARWLSGVEGRRKAIVLISESGGLGSSRDLEMVDRETSDVRDLLQATARGNASIYAIDPRGNPRGAARGIKPVLVDDDVSLSDEAFRRQGLLTLAEATGGFALTGSNDFSMAFGRIVTDMSSYYLLGYSSTDSRKDGRFRRIEVKTDRPGLRVVARSGYVAKDIEASKRVVNPAGMPPGLADVLQSPLPVPGLTLHVSAASFGGAGLKPSTAVIVEARGRDLAFTETAGRLNGSMAIVIVAADKDGKVRAGERGSLTLRLLPGTYEAISQHGVRVLSRLELNPGRYQLRVAAIDVGGGRQRGSVLYDLVVPDFSKGALAMSGIALASVEASRAPTSGNDQHWRQLLAAPPTTRRDFTADDELREYVEIYDNDKGGGHRVDFVTTVRTESGEVVFRRQQVPAGEAAKGKATINAFVTPIPLKGMSAGRYVLTSEAQSSVKDKAAVSRQIPFAIR